MTISNPEQSRGFATTSDDYKTVDDHTAYYLLSAPSGFAQATVNLLRHMDAHAREGRRGAGALFIRPDRAYSGQSGTAYISLQTLRAYDNYLDAVTRIGDVMVMLDRFDSRITRITGAQLPDFLVELGGTQDHLEYYRKGRSDDVGPDWTENDVSDVLAAYLRSRHPEGWSSPRIRRPTATHHRRPRD